MEAYLPIGIITGNYRAFSQLKLQILAGAKNEQKLGVNGFFRSAHSYSAMQQLILSEILTLKLGKLAKLINLHR